MPIDALIQEAKGMTDDSIIEVLHFMQYLKNAPKKKTFDMISSAGLDKNVYRKPGLYKGRIRMAEGFDAPLEDFREYM